MAVQSEPSLDSILSSRNLSRDDINLECSLDHCNEIALKITTWKSLCPFIGLDQQDEASIDEDYRKHKEKKIGMFRVWIEKLGPEATYLRLAEGFEKLKWRNRIIELLDLFSKGRETIRAQRPKPTTPGLGDRPKPNQLLRLVGKSGAEIIIRDCICNNWEDLCLHLQFEPDISSASMIETIRKNTFFQVEEACREVLLKWLSGQPPSRRQPVTWETFIEVLKDMDENVLAEQIRTELN